MENQETLGITDLFMLLIILIWAINFSFIKIALDEFSPLAFNGIRLAFASIILVLVLFITKQGLKVPKKDIWKLLGMGVFVAYIGLMIYFQKRAPIGRAFLQLLMVIPR